MKNLHIAIILIIVVSVGLMIPVQPTKAEWVFTDCYHEDDGVRDAFPFYSFQGTGICPSAANYLDLDEIHKSYPGAAPSECVEVPVIEY